MKETFAHQFSPKHVIRPELFKLEKIPIYLYFHHPLNTDKSVIDPKGKLLSFIS